MGDVIMWRGSALSFDWSTVAMPLPEDAVVSIKAFGGIHAVVIHAPGAIKYTPDQCHLGLYDRLAEAYGIAAAAARRFGIPLCGPETDQSGEAV